MSKMQNWVTAVTFAFLFAGTAGAAVNVVNPTNTVNERMTTEITMPNKIGSDLIQAYQLPSTATAHGSVSYAPNIAARVFAYTPNNPYVGPDSFLYLVATNADAYTTGTPVFDVTVEQPIIVANLPDNPVATGHAYSFAETVPDNVSTGRIDLLSLISDPDVSAYTNYTFTLDTTGITNGTLTAVSSLATNSVWNYVANLHAGNVGDSFRYYVTDNTGLTSGWATVTINVQNVSEKTTTKDETMFIERQAGVTNAFVTLTGSDPDVPYTNLVWSFVQQDQTVGAKVLAPAYGTFVITNNTLAFYANTNYLDEVTEDIPFYVAQIGDAANQSTTNKIHFFYCKKNAPIFTDLDPAAGTIIKMYDGDVKTFAATAYDAATNSPAGSAYTLTRWGMKKVEWFVDDKVTNKLVKTDTAVVSTNDQSQIASSLDFGTNYYALVTDTTNITVRAVAYDLFDNVSTNVWSFNVNSVNDQIISFTQDEYDVMVGADATVSVSVNTGNTNLVWSINDTSIATIEGNGTQAKVTAKTSGTAWISVTAKAFDKYAAATKSFCIKVNVMVPITVRALTIMENGEVTTNSANTVTVVPAKTGYKWGDEVGVIANAGDGYTFMKWLGDASGTANPYPFSVAAGKTGYDFVAVFKLGSATINAAIVNPGNQKAVVGARVGGAYSDGIWITVIYEGTKAPTMTATGLPSGMSLSQSDGSYTITGAPKTAGDYAVTLTIGSQSVTFTISVEALPAWAVGTFNGYWTDDNGLYGPASYTIQSNGRSSGKFLAGGETVSVSATAIAEVTYNEVDGTIQGIAISTKNGYVLSVQEDGTITIENRDSLLSRNADTIYDGYYTVSLPYSLDGVPDTYTGCGFLGLTVASTVKSGATNSTVKVAGQLADGTAVSLSTALFNSNEAIVYAAPTKYRNNQGNGYVFYHIYFETNSTATVVTTYPQYNRWVNYKFASQESEYGTLDEGDLDVVGGLFGNVSSLSAFYTESLTVDGVTVPSFDYLEKVTEIGDTGKAVTSTSVDTATAADQSVNGVTVSAAFVVGKADKVTKVKNSDGTYTYVYDDDSNSDGTLNTAALTIKLSKKSSYYTGIFSGAFTAYYDYVSAENIETGVQTVSHLAKKINYAGILVPVRADGYEDYPEGRGYFLWSRKYYYHNYDNGVSYPTTESYDFQLVY